MHAALRRLLLGPDQPQGLQGPDEHGLVLLLLGLGLGLLLLLLLALEGFARLGAGGAEVGQPADREGEEGLEMDFDLFA